MNTYDVQLRLSIGRSRANEKLAIVSPRDGRNDVKIAEEGLVLLLDVTAEFPQGADQEALEKRKLIEEMLPHLDETHAGRIRETIDKHDKIIAMLLDDIRPASSQIIVRYSFSLTKDNPI